jgi:hypothetical protein
MIFLRPQNDSEKARERAIQNRGKQEELHTSMMGFVSAMKKLIDEHGLPITSKETHIEMNQFYDFLAIARTSIHHDYKSGEIDEIPESEYPTRIANTVSRFCEVHALFYGLDEVGKDDTAFGERVIY